MSLKDLLLIRKMSEEIACSKVKQQKFHSSNIQNPEITMLDQIRGSLQQNQRNTSIRFCVHMAGQGTGSIAP